MDDFILRDLELDDGVRTAFEKCRQFDRDNPAAPVLLKIFPDGKFSDHFQYPALRNLAQREKIFEKPRPSLTSA